MKLTAKLVSAAAAAVALAGIAAPAFAAGAPPETARLDPFTGKLTTSYTLRAGIAYYFWQYDPNENYCVYGGRAGAHLVMHDTCNGNNAADDWTAGTWGGSGPWAGDYYLKDALGYCALDPSGHSNARLETEPCAKVGGQAWYLINALYSGAWVWINGYSVSVHSHWWVVAADAYGDQKNGAWVVSATVVPGGSGGSYPPDTSWNGP